MAINVYSGVMGSGKTFELIKSVIIPSLACGRRVVSNISGLNFDLIKKYIIDSKKKKEDEIGQLILVDDDRITQPNFFPIFDSNNESIVQPGDMVCIDEAWRFWSTSEKLIPEHMDFFRMHRHLTHSVTGVSCDLSLIFQSVSDLHRNLKSVIEFHFRCVKLKSLGLNNFYRVEVYQGAKQTKSALVSSERYKYDKSIFPLYKSYAGQNGTEVTTDKRTSLFRNRSFIFLGLFALLLIILGYRQVNSFFYTDGQNKDKHNILNSAPINNQKLESSIEDGPVKSKEFMLVGTISIDSFSYFIVVDSKGKIKYLDKNEIGASGLRFDPDILFENEIINYRSGSEYIEDLKK